LRFKFFGTENNKVVGHSAEARALTGAETAVHRSASADSPHSANADRPATSSADLAGLAKRENFPVALRILPKARRHDLMAVYAFARTTDDIGDRTAPESRMRLLDELDADVCRLAAGAPKLPVVRALTDLVRTAGLDPRLLRDLIQANRQDQVLTSYRSFDELLGYCRLSANPVGRIVLQLFGVLSEDRAAFSDQICTGLQLAEHWQDVAEDRRAGRVYLPSQDLERFGCDLAELDAASASPRLRELMAFEVDRASKLLDAGAPLVGTLRGWPRLAVAGYLAGGRAALAAITAARYDVLSGTPRPSKSRTAAGLVRAMVTGR
jgi:squalene synthase HpnC